jgi:hypothetical protein
VAPREAITEVTKINLSNSGSNSTVSLKNPSTMYSISNLTTVVASRGGLTTTTLPVPGSRSKTVVGERARPLSAVTVGANEGTLIDAVGLSTFGDGANIGATRAGDEGVTVLAEDGAFERGKSIVEAGFAIAGELVGMEAGVLVVEGLLMLPTGLVLFGIVGLLGLSGILVLFGLAELLGLLGVFGLLVPGLVPFGLVELLGLPGTLVLFGLAELLGLLGLLWLFGLIEIVGLAGLFGLLGSIGLLVFLLGVLGLFWLVGLLGALKLSLLVGLLAVLGLFWFVGSLGLVGFFGLLDVLKVLGLLG